MAAKRRRSGSLGVPLTEAPGEAVFPPRQHQHADLPGRDKARDKQRGSTTEREGEQRLKQPSATAGDLWPGPLLPARAPPRPEAPAARLCLQSPQPTAGPRPPRRGCAPPATPGPSTHISAASKHRRAAALCSPPLERGGAGRSRAWGERGDGGRQGSVRVLLPRPSPPPPSARSSFPAPGAANAQRGAARRGSRRR